MRNIISKGKAQIVQNPDEDGWYIPHHAVFSQQNPEKLTVVFDCSASFKGKSLNKQLLSWPDLYSNLAGLLCRFQKERIAVMCDIQKMFHQFRVTHSDTRYIQFLWYGENSHELKDYQMNECTYIRSHFTS